MIVVAWIAVLGLGLGLLGWVCDRWPSRSDDDRSVDAYSQFLADLEGRR